MRYIKGALSILVLALIVIFAVQNLEAIDVSFLSWSVTVPKFLVIIGNYFLGMITGAWLFDFLKHLFKSDKAAK
jgi:putative membrane protein